MKNMFIKKTVIMRQLYRYMHAARGFRRSLIKHKQVNLFIRLVIWRVGGG